MEKISTFYFWKTSLRNFVRLAARALAKIKEINPITITSVKGSQTFLQFYVYQMSQ